MLHISLNKKEVDMWRFCHIIRKMVQPKKATTTTTNSIRTEYIECRKSIFSFSCDFFAMMILVRTYNVMCCVVHEHFVVSDYYIYFERTYGRLSDCIGKIEHLVSFTLLLSLSLSLAFPRFRRTMYNQQQLCDWLLLAQKRENHCNIAAHKLWFFITVMQFLNGLLNVILCNFPNEKKLPQFTLEYSLVSIKLKKINAFEGRKKERIKSTQHTY